MGLTSRCPGCKLPKVDHSFGKPGKYCQGQEFSEKQGEDEFCEVLDEDAADSTRALLVSLTSTVKDLSSAVTDLRKDQEELKALVKVPQTSSISTDASKTDKHTAKSVKQSDQVTLHELRAMKDLAEKVETRVAHLELLDSDSSDGNFMQ